jgi:hypothetical protein
MKGVILIRWRLLLLLLLSTESPLKTNVNRTNHLVSFGMFIQIKIEYQEPSVTELDFPVNMYPFVVVLAEKSIFCP